MDGSFPDTNKVLQIFKALYFSDSESLKDMVVLLR